MAESSSAASTPVDEERELQVAREIISALIAKGIKLLALDFDLTIIDIHTVGAWRGPSTKLATHVRPCFKALIEAALAEQTTLHVCVVTYSSQPGLIEDVLKAALPKHCDTSRVVIRAVSKDWSPQRPVSAGAVSSSQHVNFLGKEEHLARVTTDLYNWRRAIIQAHEILLIDDDEENVNVATSFGHHGYLVPETVTIDDIAKYVETMSDEAELEMPRGVTVIPGDDSPKFRPPDDDSDNEDLPREIPSEKLSPPVKVVLDGECVGDVKQQAIVAHDVEGNLPNDSQPESQHGTQGAIVPNGGGEVGL